MSAIKYPDTPNGRRERRAKILELKEKIRKKNDLLRVINETYSNLGELYPRMTEATDGKVPIIPLIIARSIWMNQKPQVTAFLKEQWAKTERQKSILEKLESSEPLDEFLKEAILQAVYKFDTDFLESLVKAIHLVKSDDFHNSNVVQVISCHEVFRRLHQENPTNRKLLELLNESPRTYESRKELSGTFASDGVCLLFLMFVEDPRKRGSRKNPTSFF